MNPNALAWAQKLRKELLERIEELRGILSGVEPLRDELRRLEAQLEGVERLIAVCTAGSNAPEAAVASLVQTAVQTGPVAIQREAHLPPALGSAVRDVGRALKAETLRLLALWRAGFARTALALRVRLAAFLIGPTRRV